MRLCPNCGQDDETDNKSCAFCGWPGIIQKEVPNWPTHLDTSPDGRMLESNPMYSILKTTKEKWNAK